jgi:aldose 1-epimerase
MNPRVFGEADGRAVYEVTLRAADGAAAKVITWGATVRDLVVPLGAGRPQRVVLGFDALEPYVDHARHFGAIAGRYGNRIANGRFQLGGRQHQLPLNWKDKHSLHGGARGFSRRPWQIAAVDDSSVALTLVSADGDEGYPGAVTVACVYRLAASTLRVELSAMSDAETPINLCQHSYFNLDGSPSILDHTLQLAADFYTPTDADLIPTGEVRAVAGTPYDFRAPRPVHFHDETAARPFRYDINFVLRRDRIEPSPIDGAPLGLAGVLASARSGVALEVWSTEPGLQVYDGWMTDVPVPGLHGGRYGANAGICLEPQRFPDSPNRPHFPDAILRPGRVYRQVTEYRFAAQRSQPGA